MKTTRMNRRKRAYAEPSVQLIDLESIAPLLANSVDVLEGDTGSDAPQGGISVQDFEDGGGITLP